MEGLAELGGFAGLAALITAAAGVLVQLRSLRKVREDTAQLQPDHGSSVADKVDSISKQLDLIQHAQEQASHNADAVNTLITDRLHMHDIELRDIKKRLNED